MLFRVCETALVHSGIGESVGIGFGRLHAVPGRHDEAGTWRPAFGPSRTFLQYLDRLQARADHGDRLGIPFPRMHRKDLVALLVGRGMRRAMADRIVKATITFWFDRLITGCPVALPGGVAQATNVRTGFLSDEQYTALLNELPAELKPLFATACETGIRKGELLAIRWDQVDFEAGFIALETGETKNGEGRTVPIVGGDMQTLRSAAKKQRDENWPDSPGVFNRQGEQIKDLRWAWKKACERAKVPDTQKFHDLRRTAVRNMRRAGVSQAVRMKISGHKTDSMERRYNIIDTDDIAVAKAQMEARVKEPKS